MALSYVQYAGNGSTNTYNVPFQYLSRTHVHGSIDGTEVGINWLNANTIQFTSTPGNGVVVEIRRLTPRNAVLVDFVDGSTLTESDLDTATLQTFFLAQEAFDLQGGTLGLAPDGSFSAYNRRLTNVGEPINASDAVTKGYHDGTFIPQMNNLLTQATQVKDQSATAKGQSEAARDAANQSKSAAAVSEANAKTSETNAKTSENNAGTLAGLANSAKDRAILAETTANNAAQTATDKAGQAQSSADTALTQAGISNQRAIDSAASATNSANSATAAATARDKAQKWAEENEDVAVETGMFSAKHWARKAMAMVGGMKLPAIVAGAYMRGKADLSSWETVTPAQVRADLNAASRGGDTFTGQVKWQSAGDCGAITMNATGDGKPGYVEFIQGGGTRVGYIGQGDDSNRLWMSSEQGWEWYFNGTVRTNSTLRVGGDIYSGNKIEANTLRVGGDIYSGSKIEANTLRASGASIYVDNPGFDNTNLWLRTQGTVARGLFYYSASEDTLRIQLRDGDSLKSVISLHPDGSVEISGGTISANGNLYMGWAHDWLSNVLDRKLRNFDNCSGAGIVNGYRPYLVCADGGGSVYVPRNASDRDVAFTWDGGSLYYNIDGTTGWRPLLDNVNHSDLRIKMDVKEMKAGLDVIKSLNPVTFRYDPEKAPMGIAAYNLGVRYGFIAQEVMKVFPDAVQEIDIPFDANGETEKVVNGKKIKFKKEDWEDKLKIVQKEEFIAVLVKAVQELASRVEKLEAKK